MDKQEPVVAKTEGGEAEVDEGGEEGEDEDSESEAKVELTTSGGVVNVKTKKQQLVRGRYGKREV